MTWPRGKDNLNKGIQEQKMSILNWEKGNFCGPFYLDFIECKCFLVLKLLFICIFLSTMQCHLIIFNLTFYILSAISALHSLCFYCLILLFHVTWQMMGLACVLRRLTSKNIKGQFLDGDNMIYSSFYVETCSPTR